MYITADGKQYITVEEADTLIINGMDEPYRLRRIQPDFLTSHKYQHVAHILVCVFMDVGTGIHYIFPVVHIMASVDPVVYISEEIDGVVRVEVTEFNLV